MRYRARAFAAVLFGWLAVLVSPARAQSERPAYEALVPAFVGATGLLDVPSGAVQRPLTGTVFMTDVSGQVGGGGIVGIANRLEIGAAGGTVAKGRTNVIGTAKAVVVPETLLAPSLAVGVIDPTHSGRDGTSGYVVFSKLVIPYFVDAVTGERHLALSIDAGYGGGFYGRTAFGAVEIAGDGGLGVIAEVVRGRPNLGLRYTAADVSATVGWMDVRRVEASLSWSLSRW